MTDAKARHPKDADHGHGKRDGGQGKHPKPVRVYDAPLDVARRAAAGLEANPIGLLVGGLTLGAVAGVLLPRSEREKTLLAPVGQRLVEGARSAIAAAKEAGQAELVERGISRDAAQAQVRSLFDGVVHAAAVAGSAGAAAAKAGAAKTG